MSTIQRLELPSDVPPPPERIRELINVLGPGVVGVRVGGKYYPGRSSKTVTTTEPTEQVETQPLPEGPPLPSAPISKSAPPPPPPPGSKKKPAARVCGEPVVPYARIRLFSDTKETLPPVGRGASGAKTPTWAQLRTTIRDSPYLITPEGEKHPMTDEFINFLERLSTNSLAARKQAIRWICEKPSLLDAYNDELKGMLRDIYRQEELLRDTIHLAFSDSHQPRFGVLLKLMVDPELFALTVRIWRQEYLDQAIHRFYAPLFTRQSLRPKETPTQMKERLFDAAVLDETIASLPGFESGKVVEGSVAAKFIDVTDRFFGRTLRGWDKTDLAVYREYTSATHSLWNELLELVAADTPDPTSRKMMTALYAETAGLIAAVDLTMDDNPVSTVRGIREGYEIRAREAAKESLQLAEHHLKEKGAAPKKSLFSSVQKLEALSSQGTMRTLTDTVEYLSTPGPVKFTADLFVTLFSSTARPEPDRPASGTTSFTQAKELLRQKDINQDLTDEERQKLLGLVSSSINEAVSPKEKVDKTSEKLVDAEFQRFGLLKESTGPKASPIPRLNRLSLNLLATRSVEKDIRTYQDLQAMYTISSNTVQSLPVPDTLEKQRSKEYHQKVGTIISRPTNLIEFTKDGVVYRWIEPSEADRRCLWPTTITEDIPFPAKPLPPGRPNPYHTTKAVKEIFEQEYSSGWDSGNTIKEVYDQCSGVNFLPPGEAPSLDAYSQYFRTVLDRVKEYNDKLKKAADQIQTAAVYKEIYDNLPQIYQQNEDDWKHETINMLEKVKEEPESLNASEFKSWFQETFGEHFQEWGGGNVGIMGQLRQSVPAVQKTITDRLDKLRRVARGREARSYIHYFEDQKNQLINLAPDQVPQRAMEFAKQVYTVISWTDAMDLTVEKLERIRINLQEKWRFEDLKNETLEKDYQKLYAQKV